MNAFLQYLNLLGVLALAGLCGMQWETNSKLNLDINRLEKIRLDQSQKIEDQEKTISRDAADLDDFRTRLSLCESELKTSQSNLATAVMQRDQLKASLDQWVKAVAQRDAALKQAGEQIQKIAAERNKVVGQFNDLASKYNAIVKQMDEERAKQ